MARKWKSKGVHDTKTNTVNKRYFVCDKFRGHLIATKIVKTTRTNESQSLDVKSQREVALQ